MPQSELYKARARELRQNRTDAEHLLWYPLRAHRFMGLSVRRQAPIGPYIADFLIPAHRLILKADGSHHSPTTDHRRDDAHLRALGFRTIRFSNQDILTNLPGCLARLAKEIRP
jgi:very-short-patch-repair endonuclease